jgi:pimeloyl-ACP methyl ester carboxylesterase
MRCLRRSGAWRWWLRRREHHLPGANHLGREDRVVPLDSGSILQKLIPNADMHIYSNCGHWAQWENG